MSDWLPIDTAPKDGTLILCWPRDDEHATAYWQEGRWRVGCCGQSYYNIKYWMPLPSPPENS